MKAGSPCDEHDQSVQAEGIASGTRKALPECREEGFVQWIHGLVALAALPAFGLKASSLFRGVRELGEPEVRKLSKLLDKVRAGVGPGEPGPA